MSEDWSKDIFLEEAQELLAELETTLLELEQDSGDKDLINRVFRALHTIKGSGSMFGFEEIADFTHEVESVFDQLRDGKLKVTPELLNVSFRARDHIKNLLENSFTEHEKMASMESILQELARVATGDPVDTVETVETVETVATNQPETEAVEPSSVEESLPAAEEAVLQTFEIRITPKTAPLPKDYALDSLLEELEDIGELHVEEHLQDSDDVFWNVVLTTDRDVEDVRDVFFFADIDLNVDIHPFEDPVPSEPVQGTEPVVAPPVQGDEGTTEEPAAGSAEPQPTLTVPEKQPVSAPLQNSAAKKRVDVDTSMSSLRVAASKLDKLVNLVGELVIVQSQISELASERVDPALTVLSENLERLSEELRDTTLGVRMVPIGSTFSKFRRLVRDLCAELGKEIELVTVGAETELDKTVIEHLSDPLVHLLRNSMDHGIETPQEREQAGKPRKGTIRLSAEHSGGEVLICVQDNGRGMDLKAICARALDQGLIETDADLSDQEVCNLIFEPGFSMAKEVTSVSGRGVGMDVVKKAIDSLRGTIDVRTTPGEGMTIAIRLPLTLAIIDGLQIRTGDEYYVIPLTLVEECVELVEGEAHEEGGRRSLDLRGELVPYINLREWFQVPGQRPAIEQVVVTGVNGERVGFVVDEVIGEHQTVIKTLGKVYRHVEGISGATIKGDGSIALILDVPGLVRRVVAETA